MQIPQRRATIALAAALVAGAAAWYGLGGPGFSSTDFRLLELDARNLLNLQREFNRAAHAARVVVLLSPT